MRIVASQYYDPEVVVTAYRHVLAMASTGSGSLSIASLAISAAASLLTICGVGFAIRQILDGNRLLRHVQQMARVLGEISIINAHIARDLSTHGDIDLLPKEYAVLLDRAVVLLGDSGLLEDLIGEFR